jgi:hypothetical protein
LRPVVNAKVTSNHRCCRRHRRCCHGENEK